MNRLSSFLLGISTLWSVPAFATTWYVSGTGNNSNDGLSSQTPFATLQRAANKTAPGDLVYVLNGTYVVPYAGGNVLNINTSGTPSAVITYAAYPGAHPLINFSNGWTGIQVNASYITISGFEVAGDAKQVTLAYAQANQTNLGSYVTNADAIDIGGLSRVPSHVIISGNLVHDSPGGGISSMRADYITIADNVVYGNGFWSPYADSGISIFESRNTDTATGYKNFVYGNLSYGNRNYIAWHLSGQIEDGEGIIIDDNLNAENDNVAYNGRTYVTNNIVANNGGVGILTYSSQHVDVICNTAYANSQTATLNEGGIIATSAADVNMLDNIIYAAPNRVFYSADHNAANVASDYNVLFSTTVAGGMQGNPIGPHDIVADPLFVNAAAMNFNLQLGSPAIDSAKNQLVPSIDFNLASRPSGLGFDRGAIEYQFHSY